MSNVQPNAMPRKPPESAEATSNLSGCEIRASPLLLFFGGSYSESSTTDGISAFGDAASHQRSREAAHIRLAGSRLSDGSYSRSGSHPLHRVFSLGIQRAFRVGDLVRDDSPAKHGHAAAWLTVI